MNFYMQSLAALKSQEAGWGQEVGLKWNLVAGLLRYLRVKGDASIFKVNF